MTTVTARLPTGKSVDGDAFTDLTAIPVLSVGWTGEGLVEVVFAGDLDGVTVAAVHRRITSTSLAEEQLRAQAMEAAERLEQWTGLATLTALDGRLEALTAQVAALTRIVLDDHDTEGPT